MVERKEGQRAYGERPYQRGKNVTLIGALGLTGFVAAWTTDGGINGDAFIGFVEQMLIPNLWPGACVVMDNLPAHKVEEVRPAIEAVGAFLSLFISLFSRF